MTKQELCNVITDKLLDEQLLNEVDFPDLNSLKVSVKDVVLDCLKDYVIISGQILE